MKSRPSPVFALAAVFAAGLLVPGTGRGYDSPNFDVKPFSPDGIFLTASERQSLLEALTSLAVNFPSSRQLDDDLREKAIGLALQIDPLHFSARRAHDAFVRGETPEKTRYFDSLNAVSEALWRTASTLLRAPVEPDEAELAPYLMELSLLVDPDPPTDRLESFALHSGGRNPGWNRFLELQPSEEKSTRQAQLLLVESNELLAASLRKARTEEDETDSSDRPPDAVAMQGDSDGPGDPAPDDPNPDDDSPPDPDTVPTPDSEPSMEREDFEPFTARLPGIHTIRSVEEKPIYGETRLRLQAPIFATDPSDTPPAPAADDAFLPLRDSGRGIPLAGLEMPRSVLENDDREWPDNAVGVVSFETDQVLPGPRRLSSVSARLPLLVLLEIAVGDAERNEDFLLFGDAPTSGEAPSIGGDIASLWDALPARTPDYLLVPEQILEDLIREIQTTDDLTPLFADEWISYDSESEAVSRLTNPTPDSLLEASTAFREIEAVSERMSLVDLARNAKVQERLAGILETCPDHLSARAMLEYGTRPKSPEVVRLVFGNRIRDLIEPFLVIDEEIDLNELEDIRDRLAETGTALSRMRTELPTELLDLHGSAEDVAQAAEAYLGLSNPDTSIGQQRLRELLDYVETWESEATELYGEEWIESGPGSSSRPRGGRKRRPDGPAIPD